MFACFISWTLTFTANVSCMKIALCELPSSHDSTSPRKTWKFSRWSFRLARKGSKILSSTEKDYLKYWKYSSMPFLFMIAGTNVLSRWGKCGNKMFWIASSNVFGKQCSPFHCPHHHSTLARLLQHESQHSWTALSLSWLHFLILYCKLSLHQLQILLSLLINACIILTKYLRSASLWCLNAAMVRVFLRDFHAWEISCEISLLSSSQFSSASWCWVVLIFLLDWRLNI